MTDPNPLVGIASGQIGMGGTAAISQNLGAATARFQAWCAQYTNSVLAAAGFPTNVGGTGLTAIAANYATYGAPETPGQVQAGDLLINMNSYGGGTGGVIGATGGHVGIATGSFDANGNPIGIASSSNGVQLQSFPGSSVVRAPPDSLQDALQDAPDYGISQQQATNYWQDAQSDIADGTSPNASWTDYINSSSQGSDAANTDAVLSSMQPAQVSNFGLDTNGNPLQPTTDTGSQAGAHHFLA
jgi:hypothetical protein